MNTSKKVAILVAASLSSASATALAAPAVWVVDDGEKIKQDATALPLASGTSNPVWSPGQPVKLIALRNETVAMQVVVGADAAAVQGVSVELDGLTGPNGAAIRNAAGATDPTNFVGRPIERFVEHYFDITRASGGKSSGESLGWSSGSGPAAGAWTGLVPDALIPVESAPAWDPYPMNVAANRNGVVWIDVTVPPTQAAGTYKGNVVVTAQSGASKVTLATLPVELQVAGATLPDRPVQTMLYYDKSELTRRIGTSTSEEQLWKLYHRHRLVPMHGAMTATDAQAHLAALDGSEYTAAHGYEGPGVGQGDGVLSLGTYGDYGAPSAANLAKVAGVADLLATKNLFPTTDVFVYAIDESCGSSYGADWKTLLEGSTDANVGKVKVGWTCSQSPASQPVDVPIVFASSYDKTAAAAASAAGKTPWIYNGSRPQTDAFFTDTPAISLRANGWIAAMAAIPRWFYWETTFWYDSNNGGKGAYDPFTTAETFHNGDGDYCEGDGVLVYPGKQVDQFTDHSVGIDGVLASIRLKNLRRGVEDAGYYQLAHAADAAKAEAIATGLLPKILSAAKSGQPSWPAAGQPWFEARKALLALIPQTAPAPADADSGASNGTGGVTGEGADGGAATGQAGGSGVSGADGGPGDDPGTGPKAANLNGSNDSRAIPADGSGGGCSVDSTARRTAGWGYGVLPCMVAALALLLRRRRGEHM